ncbi:MAG: flagellar basal-body MS-ring/collar protein FliF [Sphingomonadales bacterium]
MNGFVNTLRSLGPARLLAIGVVLIGLLGFFAFITDRLTTPPMALLYGGLDTQDSAEIISKLDGLRTPYRLVGNGTSIMVPEDQVPRLRIMMAEQGLPTGGSMGYEIFDRSDAFGTTSFVQNINHVRALEGELARTIRSINNVAAARVHLVLPERKLFRRETLNASASIVLKTRSGALSHSQISAIQHLAAAAVPGLTPGGVSIVDERGTLLATGIEEAVDGGGHVNSLQDRKTEQEARLKRQLEGLLEKYVGPNQAQVEVSIELDFDRVTTNSEIYDPDRQVVVSTQTVEDSQRSQDTQTTGGNVSVGNNLPDSAQSAAGKSSNNSRLEETTNFENSKIIRTEIHEAGQIKSLSVAVLVDGTYQQNEDGATTYSPRPQNELDQLATLVRSAVGFNADRGDVVEIINLRFAATEPPRLDEAPEGFLGLDLGKSDIFRAAELIVFLLVGLLAILFVARPMVNRLFAGAPVAATAAGGVGQIQDSSSQIPALPGPEGTVPATATDTPAGAAAQQQEMVPNLAQRSNIESMIDVAQIDGQIQQSAVKKVGEIVENHPDEAATILRAWLHG